MNSHTLDISPRYKEMHSKITFEHFSKLGNLSVALGYRENPFILIDTEITGIQRLVYIDHTNGY